MQPNVVFYPVDNGDMVLVTLHDETRILIDTNIRSDADDPQAPMFDVAADLRRRLKKDSQGRPYVDVFLNTHPDQDHCRGVDKHFHLGSPEEYCFDPPDGEDLKIFIHELWSSPMIFRRKSRQVTLCDDARALNAEARRRVRRFKATGRDNGPGERILILGEDENGKTQGLEAILVRIDETFNQINGQACPAASMRLLGPLPRHREEEDEDLLAKNRSSVILQFNLMTSAGQVGCQYLCGGDAEVLVWERLWQKHQLHPDWLRYDLLLAPHHCSWHTLSYDSWNEHPHPRVSPDARSALAQARWGAFIVASSKSIKDDGNDPPCIGARREYESILKPLGGRFFCTGEEPNPRQPEPLVFTITGAGPQPLPHKTTPRASLAGIGATREPLPHG